MVKFIEKTRDPKIPMIILGDFNFKHNEETYQFFTRLLNLKNAAYQCGVLKNCEGEEDPYEIWENGLIDHQFFSSGNSGQISIKPIYYYHHFTKKEVGKYKKIPLSDHPGVMVHYEIDYSL